MSWGTEQWGFDPWGGGILTVSDQYPSLIPSNGGLVFRVLGTFVASAAYHVFVGGTGTPEVQCYSGVRGKGYTCTAAADGTYVEAVTPANLRGQQTVRVVELASGTEVSIPDALNYVQPPGQQKIFRLRELFPQSAYRALGRRRQFQRPIEDWQT